MPYLITRVSTSSTEKAHYDLDLDGEYWLTVHEDILVRMQIHKGMVLNEDVKRELLLAVEGNRAERMAIYYLGFQARTAAQVRKYLREKEFSQGTIENTIEQLQQRGYIQDEEYAKQFVNERLRVRPRGRYLLAEELKQRGISGEIISQVLAQILEEEELEACKKLAMKRLGKQDPHSEGWKGAKIKTIRHLQGKGFPYSIIQRALTDLEKEMAGSSNEEWLS